MFYIDCPNAGLGGIGFELKNLRINTILKEEP